MLIRVLDVRRAARDGIILREAEKAVREKKRAFLLVPEQATAEYETLCARRCGAPGQRYLEVTNFSRLRDVVLRQVGGVALRALGGVEKSLLLALTLTDRPGEAALLCRKNDPDAVTELAQDLEEARLAGLGEKELFDLADRAEVDEKLAEKLRAAALVTADWHRRTAALADVCPDPERQLLLALEKAPFFRDSVVFVHDFRSFTAPQEAILRRVLHQADDLWVSLPCRRQRDDLYEKAFDASMRLYRAAAADGVACRDEEGPADEETGELAFLQKHLLENERKDGEPLVWSEAPRSLSVTAAADAVEEAAFVASRIRSAVVEEGCRWNEIAVLSRSGETDRILSRVLEEADIPHYLEKKEPLSRTPAARLLLLAARIASGVAWRGEEREYLQNPLLRLEEEERFLLDRYVVTWSIGPAELLRSADFTKNPEGFETMRERGQRELDAVNAARCRAVEPLRGLAGALAAGNCAEKVTALVDFLRAVGAEAQVNEERRRALDRGAFDDAAAAVREWNCVLARLGSLAEIAGEEEAPGREFLHLLGLALSGEAPGEVPPAQDAVPVGTVELARPSGIRKLFVIGMNAGVFPKGEIPGRLFNEKDRTAIEACGYPLSHPEARRKEEAFFFSLAASLPSEELILSYRTRGDRERDKGTESVF
ncbi:MAG: hypothetical protein II776_03390, partial [Clostridia bacterium]|nr:hypothetical protein [Clostridia bacterium]